MTFTEIKIELIRAGVRPADIAHKLGVSKQAVHLVMKGASTSRRIKAEIAASLNLTIADLWPRATPKTTTEINLVLAASERSGLDVEFDLDHRAA